MNAKLKFDFPFHTRVAAIAATAIFATPDGLLGGTDYHGLWVGQATLTRVNEVSVPLDEDNIARAPEPKKPTPTNDAANLKLILHVDGAGNVSLLRDVAILSRVDGALASESDMSLVTDERLYAEYPSQPAVRIASAVFDFGDNRATDALLSIIEVAAQEAAASIGGSGEDLGTIAGRRKAEAEAQQAAGALADQVVASADVEEAYRQFLAGFDPAADSAGLDAAALEALSLQEDPTTAFGLAAGVNPENPYPVSAYFHQDLRAANLVQAVRDAAAEDRSNVASSFADVSGEYERFLAGKVFGDMIAGAAANVTSVVSGGRIVSGVGGASGESPLRIAATGHGLESGDLVRLSGSSITSYNGTFPITQIDANAFSIEVEFEGIPQDLGFWLPVRIADYEGSDGLAPTTLVSPSHGLVGGERIIISGAGVDQYNGVHTVSVIDPRRFSINVPFAGNPGVEGTWLVDRSVAITNYAGAGGDPETIVLAVGHGLADGSRIVVSGAEVEAYNGHHTVTLIDADSFSIPVPFAGVSGAPGAFTSAEFLYDAIGDDPSVDEARTAGNLTRVPFTKFDDTRAAGAIDVVIAALVRAAIEGVGPGLLGEVDAAGRTALNGQVDRYPSPVPDPSASYPDASISPTADYIDFVRSDTFGSAGAIAAEAAAGAAASERANNALFTPTSLYGAAKAGAANALRSALSEAARAMRSELPLAGSFGPGEGDTRFVADVSSADGDALAAAGLAGTIRLPAAHPTNPFRHRRHPDHTVGFGIERRIRLDFDGAAGDPLPSGGFGVVRITGTYREEIHGLHKPLGTDQDTGLKVEGTFELSRVSLIDRLNAR